MLLRIGEETYGVEQTPTWGQGTREIVAEGPVGLRLAEHFGFLRYEVHITPHGGIPDLGEAIGGPRELGDEALARRLRDVVREVPVNVWGRKAPSTGEMWNSNSVISWTLARSGVDAEDVTPPPGGRAPGWKAGLLAA